MAKVFKFLDKNHKVELRLSTTQGATYKPMGFDVNVPCNNDYYWKKYINQLMFDRIMFQQYTLHVQKNCTEISTVNVYHAEDIKIKV